MLGCTKISLSSLFKIVVAFDVVVVVTVVVVLVFVAVVDVLCLYCMS